LLRAGTSASAIVHEWPADLWLGWRRFGRICVVLRRTLACKPAEGHCSAVARRQGRNLRLLWLVSWDCVVVSYKFSSLFVTFLCFGLETFHVLEFPYLTNF
jgi:hypothetical protein